MESESILVLRCLNGSGVSSHRLVECFRSVKYLMEDKIMWETIRTMLTVYWITHNISQPENVLHMDRVWTAFKVWNKESSHSRMKLHWECSVIIMIILGSYILMGTGKCWRIMFHSIWEVKECPSSIMELNRAMQEIMIQITEKCCGIIWILTISCSSL